MCTQILAEVYRCFAPHISITRYAPGYISPSDLRSSGHSCARYGRLQRALAMEAQVAANTRGVALLKGLVSEYGLDVISSYMGHIQASFLLDWSVVDRMMEMKQDSKVQLVR